MKQCMLGNKNVHQRKQNNHDILPYLNEVDEKSMSLMKLLNWISLNKIDLVTSTHAVEQTEHYKY
uniref:Uncharacterized protein n=1 Tax=Arion vulgaris TaxID=1028688 RepID=A0A0B6Y0H8_9EUPU